MNHTPSLPAATLMNRDQTPRGDGLEGHRSAGRSTLLDSAARQGIIHASVHPLWRGSGSVSVSPAS